jgi:gamma-glutamyl-gamma-aminobutyrate hydrolase PuuD
MPSEPARSLHLRGVRVATPERLRGPHCPIPERVRTALEDLGAEVIVLRPGMQLRGVRFDSLLYGQPPTREDYDDERDHRELAAVEFALKAHKPILGLCRGMQLLAIRLGCELAPLARPRLHGGAMTRSGPAPVLHDVVLAAGSRLASLVGTTLLTGCSSHHSWDISPRDMVDALIVGTSTDVAIEALEYVRRPAVGVMWHPEDSYNLSSQQAAVFRCLAPPERPRRV